MIDKVTEELTITVGGRVVGELPCNMSVEVPSDDKEGMWGNGGNGVIETFVEPSNRRLITGVSGRVTRDNVCLRIAFEDGEHNSVVDLRDRSQQREHGCLDSYCYSTNGCALTIPSCRRGEDG